MLSNVNGMPHDLAWSLMVVWGTVGLCQVIHLTPLSSLFFYYYYKFITNDKRNLLKKLILLIHELTSSLKVSFQRYFHEFTVRRLCSSIKSLSHFFLMDYVIDLWVCGVCGMMVVGEIIDRDQITLLLCCCTDWNVLESRIIWYDF